MKSQADKIISDKLSSLESLPEGYVPNLDAKWAIIEGSVSKKPLIIENSWKPTRVLQIRFAQIHRVHLTVVRIAACLLLLIGSAMIWKIVNQPAVTIVVHSPQPMPLQNVLPKNDQQEDNKQVASVNHINKSRIRENPSINNSVVLVEPAQQIVIPVVTIPEDSNKLVAETQEVKAKQHYVEVDFSDPVPQHTAPENNFAQAFKFKLDFGKESSTPSNSKNSSSLRIHQNF